MYYYEQYEINKHYYESFLLVNGKSSWRDNSETSLTRVVFLVV